ncbi:hypothetical protein [Aneurinibacillus soli]|uniref:hypothetical protein n=1 Tax=Aneurinibacillus soli TaxID=1500254 RepID=UPI0011B40F06|nr:hypothetical protein [Aneurinibacillus soli]
MSTAHSSWKPVGTAGFSTGPAYVSFVIDNSTPYIAFADDKNTKVIIMKFNSTNSSWNLVGIRAFSSDPAYSISFAIDKGTPYVAFTDDGNNGRATVMKFPTPTAGK